MQAENLERVLAELERPLLVLSTHVGRGMASLGEALVERLGERPDVLHRPVEDFLPPTALAEDVRRYRFLSSHAPWLLHVAYRFPPVYWRKLARERWVRRTDLGALAELLEREGVKSVVCVSHRPAFWAAGLKEERGLDLRLVGLLGEYGRSLGWKYVPWGSLDAFLSPVPRAAVGFPLPAHVRFEPIELPVRRAFARLRERPGDPRSVLLAAGFWGQGRLVRVARAIAATAERAGVAAQVHAVCGDNEALRAALARARVPGVVAHGALASLAPLMERCASVVTKPGIATLVEAHAAGRKLFLLRGMPVAEDNNARHALERFGAERFSEKAFGRWLAEARAREG